jgi:hypothetical protein
MLKGYAVISIGILVLIVVIFLTRPFSFSSTFVDQHGVVWKIENPIYGQSYISLKDALCGEEEYFLFSTYTDGRPDSASFYISYRDRDPDSISWIETGELISFERVVCDDSLNQSMRMRCSMGVDICQDTALIEEFLVDLSWKRINASRGTAEKIFGL